ncbi:hypothetical protein KM043_009281 [Ampulex compressa]|nr:hypothetical protein KM043_009281 [Ampulex compressa]
MGICVQEDGFGIVPRPSVSRAGKPCEIVRRYTMTNEQNASVRLISWGAGVQSIRVPNLKGALGDVVLGFDSMDGYLENRYMGCTIGRVANRVSEGLMRIDDAVYSLTINDQVGSNHFNGGFAAFDNANWDSYALEEQVIMSHLSRAGSEGYPGNMLTQVKYTWTNDNELRINIRANATEPTAVNITNYCLFNLAGHGTGPEELRKHVVSVNADSWTMADIRDHLPTGCVCPVDRTVYDLRLPTQMTRERLYSVPGGGYNHNLCVTSPSSWCYRFHARILHPDSGRTLEVYSNQPGLQFYTCNDLPDSRYPLWKRFSEDRRKLQEGIRDQVKRIEKKTADIRGKDGMLYRRHGAFVLSPQNYPDAINIKSFPSCILYPGKVYVHDMSYKFGLLSRNLEDRRPIK